MLKRSLQRDNMLMHKSTKKDVVRSQGIIRVTSGNVAELSLSPQDVFVVGLRNLTDCDVFNPREVVLKIYATEDKASFSHIRDIDFDSEWEANIYLSCLKPILFLSFPGTFQKLNIFAVHTKHEVSAWWEKVVPDTQSHFLCNSKDKCDLEFERIELDNSYFGRSNFSLSVFHLRTGQILFSARWDLSETDLYAAYKFHSKLVKFHVRHMTWNAASIFCQKAGIHLPVFYSRGELEEL